MLRDLPLASMARQSLGVREAGQRIARDDALGILWNRRERALAGVSMDTRTVITKEFHEVAETVSGPYLELLARQSRLGWIVFGNEDIQPE